MSPFRSRQSAPMRSAARSRCSATSMPARSLAGHRSFIVAHGRALEQPANCWPLPRRAGRSTIACVSGCTHYTAARSPRPSVAGRSTSCTCTDRPPPHVPPPGVPVPVTAHQRPRGIRPKPRTMPAHATWQHGAFRSQPTGPFRPTPLYFRRGRWRSDVALSASTETLVRAAAAGGLARSSGVQSRLTQLYGQIRPTHSADGAVFR